MDKKQRDRPSLGQLWGRIAPQALLLAGAVAITTGAALLAPAAGWITGGGLALAAGVLMVIGGDGA